VDARSGRAAGARRRQRRVYAHRPRRVVWDVLRRITSETAGALEPRSRRVCIVGAAPVSRFDQADSHPCVPPSLEACSLRSGAEVSTRAPARRPGQERRSWRPARSLAREGGRRVMCRLSPPHWAFHRAGVAGHAAPPPPGKAPVCRRSACKGSCYETGGSFDDARAVSAAVTKRLGRTPWSSSRSRASISSSATSRPAAGASVTAECMTAM
jgi:hypothetical protein